MAEKLFINNTGRKLDIQLLVRKGDEPSLDAEPVNFQLGDGSSNAEDGGSDHTKLVHYGNDIDIFLNGIVVSFTYEGEKSVKRFQVMQRGVKLDNELNMNNTVEFIYTTMVQLKFMNSFNLSKNVNGEPSL